MTSNNNNSKNNITPRGGSKTYDQVGMTENDNNHNNSTHTDHKSTSCSTSSPSKNSNNNHNSSPHRHSSSPRNINSNSSTSTTSFKLHLFNCYQEHCLYLPPMLGWFFFSALLSSYNKYVFGDEHLNFPCPLLLTSIHFLAQWIVSYSLCNLFPIYMGSKRVNDMTWKEFISISIPCGLVTSGDVGLSNLSLVSITITFYTMVKASSPIFVLLWAYFFGIVRITWSLVGVVLVIAIGEFLTVAGEVEFEFNGFLLCLMATICSGARWTLVQLKLQTLEPPLKTTIATMRVLSPFMFVSMLIVTIFIEHPWTKLPGLYNSWDEIIFIIKLGLAGATIAIAMIMCEFYLIVHTNAIMLMIGGVIKEILTIFVGYVIIKISRKSI